MTEIDCRVPDRIQSNYRLRLGLQNLALFAVYVTSGKLGLSLAFLNASASAVWPPTGVALAALVLWGEKLWPGIFVGALVVNLTTQGSLTTSLGIAAGNTVEALAGCWLIARFAGGGKAFESTGTFFRFIPSVLASTMLSPIIGVTTLALAGFAQWEQYRAIWLTWWLGDLTSALLIAPLLVIWCSQGWPRLKQKQLLEGTGLLLLTVAIAETVFLWTPAHRSPGYPIIYLAIVPALWAAFRFRVRGAATISILTAAIALWGTLQGRGPFALADPNVSLLFLQAFVGTVALSSLALGSAVCESRRAQEQVRLQAVALESAANAILITDRHGSIEWVNAAFSRLTGYRREEVLGHNPRVLKSGLHGSRYFREMWQTVLSGRVWHGELVNRRKDGSFYTEEMTITPVGHSPGGDSHFVAIKQDVTERKYAEQALQKAKAETETANARLEELVERRTAKLREMVEELEHFSYSLVHDMRAPLRGIQGFASIIEEEIHTLLSPSAKEHLARIQQAAERMDQLITGALTYSGTVQGEYAVGPVNPESVLQGIVQSYPQFSQELAAIKLEGRFPLVQANQAGLTQCFSNLLQNAVKFVSPGTRPSVRVWAEEQGLMVRIWVEDNGVGLPPEATRKLFRMFQRMHGAEYDGTGIGLAVVRKLAERMGGQVGVESELGRGSRFWIELPAAQLKSGS